jgi:hypothetical protein
VASERIVDLEHKRYADREFDGELPESATAAEAHRERRRAQARARLRRRVRERPGSPGVTLYRADLVDLLILLGEEDW